MAKVIAIGGKPGSGKSTLVRRFLSTLAIENDIDTSVKLVPFHKHPHMPLYVLGKYEKDEVFGGTDKMSMACQPEVIKWMNALSDKDIVLFEGDRLFNGSFLNYCMDNHDLSIIHVKVDKNLLQDRYKERGSNQNEKWLEGRNSKINNILTNMMLKPYIVDLVNDNQSHLEDNVDYLISILKI